MTDELGQALEGLVPARAEHGDWDAVLARAGVRRSHRRVVLTAAVLALVVAAPALAVLLDVIGRKDVTFSKAPPAPNRIKKQFSELGVGAPPGESVGALAAQSRFAGTLRWGGKSRRLWVVPTRRGGYCYLLEGYGGGCAPTRVRRRSEALSVGWSYGRVRGGRFAWTGGGGVVSSPRAWRLQLELSDGRKVPVPFIWVSKPIAAGFFGFSATKGVAAVAAFDRAGRLVAREQTPGKRVGPVRIPPSRIVRVAPRRLPAQPPVAPSAPLQHGAGDGAEVVAGANGSVLFRAGAVAPARKRALARGASYSCFRLTHSFGIFDTRGTGVSGRFAPSVGLRLFGVGRPLDGCEIAGFGGHRWPDRFDSHTPVEIALTDAGRWFFADRAAARDLALFVRTRRVQVIRRHPAAQLRRELRSLYGLALARRHIRDTVTAGGVVFTKRSTTGKTFRVVVRHGRIAHQNLSPYAFVF